MYVANVNFNVISDNYYEIDVSYFYCGMSIAVSNIVSVFQLKDTPSAYCNALTYMIILTLRKTQSKTKSVNKMIPGLLLDFFYSFISFCF